MRSYSLNLKILLFLAIFLTVSCLSCKKKDADNIAVTIDGIDIPQSEIDRIVKPQLNRIAEQSE
jgi:hypothetical protein